MDNVKVEETNEVLSYIIPLKALAGFVITTNDPKEINDNFIQLAKSIDSNPEIKKAFAEFTRSLSQVIVTINPKITASVMIPNLFLPIDNENDSKLVVDFMTRLNDELIKELDGKEAGYDSEG